MLNDVCASFVTGQLNAEDLVGIKTGFSGPKSDEFTDLANAIEATWNSQFVPATHTSLPQPLERRRTE